MITTTYKQGTFNFEQEGVNVGVYNHNKEKLATIQNASVWDYDTIQKHLDTVDLWIPNKETTNTNQETKQSVGELLERLKEAVISDETISDKGFFKCRITQMQNKLK